MCVKKSAFSWGGDTLICDSRMFVPRPASNWSFIAPQWLLSSPKLTSVPAPAWPLKTLGPPWVPVSVTVRHGAASAAVVSAASTTPATAILEIRFIFGILRGDNPTRRPHEGKIHTDHIGIV